MNKICFIVTILVLALPASAIASLEIRSGIRPAGAPSLGSAKRALDGYIAAPPAGKRDQPIDCYYSLATAVCRGHYTTDHGAWRCSVRAQIFAPGIVKYARNYCVYTKTFDDVDDDPHSGSGWDRSR